MSDNFVANAGWGGDTFAADDVAGVKYPRSKVAFGSDGSATDVSTTAPLPVRVYGATDSGSLVDLATTAEGHLEVAIHSPTLPFGSLHVENMTPIFQADAVYGINTSESLATTGLGYDPGPAPGTSSGIATNGSNLFTCSTGTTAFSFASIQSRKRARYRPGQGVVGRFTSLWSAPAAESIVVAGFGTGESGFYFGYNGTSFGILHSTGGVREIQTLTISAACSSGGTVVFRLNGIDYTVTIPTGATTSRTAYDVSRQTFPGWDVSQRGSTVIFVANAVGNKAGTFSLTQGTAVGIAGTFAETVAGVASTDAWVYQTAWNGDPCDGTGPSGFTLDKTKGNVFQIGITYLGFGPVVFSIMLPSVRGNNSIFLAVHTLNIPNSRTNVSASQPSFPFTMAAYSAGSTTNVSLSVGSYACFLEGVKRATGPRQSYDSTRNNFVQSGAYYPLFTVRNEREYQGRVNQAVVNLVSIGVAHGDNTPVTFYIIRNAVLVGPVNFAAYTTNSCTYLDTGATTCIIPLPENQVFSLPTGNGGSQIFSFTDDITMQPGETITLAAKSATGTTVWVVGNLNTREDQ